MTYAILTVKQFIERHAEASAQLTDREQRIVAKTALFMGIEFNQSPEKALHYVRNLNELQRDAMKKFIGVKLKLGQVDAYTEFAATSLGLL